MGELFRSQPMQLVQLFVQVEAAHDTVDELGKLGLIQFRDLNPGVSAFQRNFVNEVKRCDEMERKLRFFTEQVEKEKVEMLIERSLPTDDTSLVHLEDGDVETAARLHMDELETLLDEQEKELLQMNKNQEMLNRNYNELIELMHVLKKDSTFFSEAMETRSEVDEGRGLLQERETSGPSVKLGFVTGVIDIQKFNTFKKILWRHTRGNLYMKHTEIEEMIRDPQTGELQQKVVFIVFYQGENAQAKIKKICESFAANLYPCSESARERKELLTQVEGRLADLKTVLDRSKKHRRGVLLNIGKNLRAWSEKVLKEKAIYHTMNLFNYDVGRKCLIAEGWCPKTATERIVTAMRQATESSGALVPSILSVIPANEEPPTYFKTNKFTRAFQALVDAYGVAHYQEVNPGPFTIITFPFLFAVMFGDFGHGLLMTLFAASLIYFEKKLENQQLNEMIKMCFDGRYMLLFMGLFSLFTGIMYNECFSIPLDIFGTNWSFPSHEHINGTNVELVASRIDPGRTYPFGVDPTWAIADNTLSYYNSLKMKLSIILGVTQMTVGIFLSLLNGLHFRHTLDIIFEFIPQMIFIMSLFGYMVFLIFYKWCIDWSNSPHGPPFLLNVMIQMFLSPIQVEPDNKVYDIEGNSQLAIQGVLLALAIVSIPIMLLPKPLILRSRHNAKKRGAPGASVLEDEHEGGEEFDFSEIFVKQCIHTIEYVLGCVSNTASYLRLWALSLAHSELSIVFWERVFMTAYAAGDGNVAVQIIMAFCGFGAWAGATFGVLLVMESLSAFLHALRLHWVEFQNKFYLGDGKPFRPFSYERVLRGEEDEN